MPASAPRRSDTPPTNPQNPAASAPTLPLYSATSCSSRLCAVLLCDAKYSAANTTTTTTTMITIKVVALTLSPPARFPGLHYSPKCNLRNVAVSQAFQLVVLVDLS